MTKLSYWWSSDKARWYPAGGSLIHCLAIAVNEVDYPFYICRARQKKIYLADYFDAQQWVINIDENQLCDEYDPENDSLLSDINITGLQEAVQAAIHKWQTDQHLVIGSWSFEVMEDVQYVEDPNLPAG